MQKRTTKNRGKIDSPPSCESCEFFDYDEEYGDYTCNQSLDEDEMEAFARRTTRACPYYRYYDEYTFVHKQN